LALLLVDLLDCFFACGVACYDATCGLGDSSNDGSDSGTGGEYCQD
jgi:hypothetical protein